MLWVSWYFQYSMARKILVTCECQSQKKQVYRADPNGVKPSSFLLRMQSTKLNLEENRSQNRKMLHVATSFVAYKEIQYIDDFKLEFVTPSAPQMVQFSSIYRLGFSLAKTTHRAGVASWLWRPPDGAHVFRGKSSGLTVGGFCPVHHSWPCSNCPTGLLRRHGYIDPLPVAGLTHVSKIPLTDRKAVCSLQVTTS